MRDKRVHPKVTPTAVPADSDESPKCVKRDGKPATERPAIHDLEVSLDRSNEERGRRRRLQDPLPLEETPHGQDGRASLQQPSKAAEQDLVDAATNIVPVNPTHVPRSGYYFQHDDRSAPAGRINKRRAYDRSGWNEHRPKARFNDRFRETSPDHQARRRDERRQGSSQIISQSKVEDTWKHDKFLEAQTEELEKRRKVPTNEKIALVEGGKYADKSAAGLEPSRETREKNTEEEREDPDKRSERRYPDMNLARRERERYRERGEELERGRWMESDQRGARFPPRGGYGRFVGGRESSGGRSERISDGNRMAVDRWSHDMFEEVNRSPTPKQEEDHVAQIEALLAA